jgi:Family of unknown function (DUF5996)
MGVLQSLSMDVKIWPKPVEMADPVPFGGDTVHASYDPEAVSKFHRILMSVASVFKDFRGDFLGKASPLHFFWVALIWRGAASAGTLRRRLDHR